MEAQHDPQSAREGDRVRFSVQAVGESRVSKDKAKPTGGIASPTFEADLSSCKHFSL